METRLKLSKVRYCSKCGRNRVPKDGCGICLGCLYQENKEAKKREAKEANPTPIVEGWIKVSSLARKRLANEDEDMAAGWVKV